MAIIDRVRELVTPLAEAASVDLYDVEHHGGTVRVLVDSDGGIDVDALARLSRSVSRALDEHDLIDGRYTLEVSSPGLERPLRTPDHFRRVTGSEVKVKTLPGFDGPRRLAGVVEAVADESVDLRDEDGRVCRIAFEQLASARTVFAWGPGSRIQRQSQQRADTEEKP
jgi:ribosome maturation factor RimP